MSLGLCRECDHQMSTTADACPNCGCTLPPRERKVRLVSCSLCKGSGSFWFTPPPKLDSKKGWVASDKTLKKCHVCNESGKVEEYYYE